jgi:hypothetical protein
MQVAVGSAVTAALTIWTNNPAADTTPAQLVEDAFDQLQSGLPDPREPQTRATENLPRS